MSIVLSAVWDTAPVFQESAFPAGKGDVSIKEYTCSGQVSLAPCSVLSPSVLHYFGFTVQY